MKTGLLTLLVPLLPACTFHIHVHEAPRAPLAVEARSATGREGSVVNEVRGLVVDADGRPAHALVALVGEGGSWSMGTNSDGRFAFEDVPQWPRIVHVTTEDGRVAIAPIARGAESRFVLQPGAMLALELSGRANARCAVFSGELRIEDFTLREGKPASVVVPIGDTRVHVYDGLRVLSERAVHLAAGETSSVRFAVGSD